VLDPGEECGDGGTVSGDTCSALLVEMGVTARAQQIAKQLA